MTATAPNAADGVRLLSQRPSLLHKLASVEGVVDGGATGIVIGGLGWEERLRLAVDGLTSAERSGVFGIRVDDPAGVPLPLPTLLARLRSDWFPGFLFRGRMHPVFQPVVDLATGTVFAREALIRGALGRGEVSGAELYAAATAHDALFSFDARTRAIALEAGLAQLPAGERLFVKLDLRAVLDVDGSLRSTWPVVERAGGHPGQVGVELMGADRQTDVGMLADLAAAHRERGALLAADNLSVSTETVRALEAIRPDVVKLGRRLWQDALASAGRRHLVTALVEVAHELGARVVAVGVERDDDLAHVRDLGADLGQGFYLGQPTAEMLPVQQRVATRAPA